MSKLVKIRVCSNCYDNPSATDCYCHYSKYKTILLEFERCECCGHISDEPANTDFNQETIEKL